ncbi:MAG: CPCC family cysteine-rich protein [Nitrospira sp.]|nr:CPCC family cysteine-rich protein [Nitrospira sp.]
MNYPCSCCGYLTFADAVGSDDICPICFWEDDVVQLAFPDMAGGANKCSLIEGQRGFAEFGACERKAVSHVRPVSPSDVRDSLWRPLDCSRDRYLHWGDRADGELWQSVKDSRDISLYYWREDYWLHGQKT